MEILINQYSFFQRLVHYLSLHKPSLFTFALLNKHTWYSLKDSICENEWDKSLLFILQDNGTPSDYLQINDIDQIVAYSQTIEVATLGVNLTIFLWDCKRVYISYRSIEFPKHVRYVYVGRIEGGIRNARLKQVFDLWVIPSSISKSGRNEYWLFGNYHTINDACHFLQINFTQFEKPHIIYGEIEDNEFFGIPFDKMMIAKEINRSSARGKMSRSGKSFSTLCNDRGWFYQFFSVDKDIYRLPLNKRTIICGFVGDDGFVYYENKSIIYFDFLTQKSTVLLNEFIIINNVYHDLGKDCIGFLCKDKKHFVIIHVITKNNHIIRFEQSFVEMYSLGSGLIKVVHQIQKKRKIQTIDVSLLFNK